MTGPAAFSGGRILGAAGAAVEKTLDLLFPPSLYCICCGNLIDGTRTYNLCDHCMAHIRWDGGPAREAGGMKTLRCVQYGIYERTLIFSLKYNRKTWIARDIAKICADRLALAEADSGLEFDLIVPVPLYREKERKRGFNQAALIGRHLGRQLHKPCLERALIRRSDTRPMRGLSPEERKENVQGKFVLDSRFAGQLQGRRVLLFDDFYTTGSTAAACRDALLAAEPAEVSFLAFAAK